MCVYLCTYVFVVRKSAATVLLRVHHAVAAAAFPASFEILILKLGWDKT
jgi:hypothetical protein